MKKYLVGWALWTSIIHKPKNSVNNYFKSIYCRKSEVNKLRDTLVAITVQHEYIVDVSWNADTPTPHCVTW